MKRGFVVILILTLFAMFTANGTAFSADRLEITILNMQGDADVRFDYTLTWYEWWVVYAKIIEPEEMMKTALEDYSGKPVDIVQVADGTTEFRVYGFAQVEEGEGILTYQIPEVKFGDSQKIVNQYWFHPFLTVDLSPDITEVTFPDGYSEQFFDTEKIPGILHDIESRDNPHFSSFEP